jgi:hypothetical protein
MAHDLGVGGDERYRVAPGHFAEQVEEQAQRRRRHGDGDPGQVVGTPSEVSATDPHGFAAEAIGAFSAARTAFAHTAKESNDSLFVGSTGDGMLAEVASGAPGAGRICWSLH